MNLMNKKLSALLIALTLLVIAPLPAFAIDYKVEIILFEHVNGGSDVRNGLRFPRTGRAFGLNTDTAAENNFILLDSGYEMNEAAEEIKNSGDYRLLQHFMWQQPGLDSKNAKAVRINVGRASSMYIPENLDGQGKFIVGSASPQPGREREVRTTTVNGTLKVRLGRFLHLETHLVYTDSERQTSFTLFQSRRMRSRETHYIDNPRFGLLARIVPIEGSET